MLGIKTRSPRRALFFKLFHHILSRPQELKQQNNNAHRNKRMLTVLDFGPLRKTICIPLEPLRETA
jgi:hypothetical protein